VISKCVLTIPFRQKTRGTSGLGQWAVNASGK
jgi:hypothetical protein